MASKTIPISEHKRGKIMSAADIENLSYMMKFDFSTERDKFICAFNLATEKMMNSAFGAFADVTAKKSGSDIILQLDVCLSFYRRHDEIFDESTTDEKAENFRSFIEEIETKFPVVLRI